MEGMIVRMVAQAEESSDNATAALRTDSASCRTELAKVKSTLNDKSQEVARVRKRLEDDYQDRLMRLNEETSWGLYCIVANRIGLDWINTEKGWNPSHLCDAARDGLMKLDEGERAFFRVACE
jgi:hypothetical protein